MKQNYLRVVTATLLFGSIGLFVRAIPLPSAVIAFARAVIGAAVLLAAAVGVRLLSDGEAIRSASAVVWML